jgi:hypothetical protein
MNDVCSLDLQRDDFQVTLIPPAAQIRHLSLLAAKAAWHWPPANLSTSLAFCAALALSRVQLLPSHGKGNQESEWEHKTSVQSEGQHRRASLFCPTVLSEEAPSDLRPENRALVEDEVG